MRKARIENGVVREVLERDPFPPFAPALVWVECPAEVVEGWTYDGAFNPPVPDPTPSMVNPQRDKDRAIKTLEDAIASGDQAAINETMLTILKGTP